MAFFLALEDALEDFDDSSIMGVGCQGENA